MKHKLKLVKKTKRAVKPWYKCKRKKCTRKSVTPDRLCGYCELKKKRSIEKRKASMVGKPRKERVRKPGWVDPYEQTATPKIYLKRDENEKLLMWSKKEKKWKPTVKSWIKKLEKEGFHLVWNPEYIGAESEARRIEGS